MAAEIEQTITVGDLPGGTGATIAPATAGQDIEVRADPTRQYTAVSPLQWYVNVARALPWAIDDVSADFGTDLYERMLLDPQCRSVVNVLKAAILETGVNLTSAIDDKNDPDFARAGDLVDRCDRMLADLETPIDDVLWDMLDAVALGNRAAE